MLEWSNSSPTITDGQRGGRLLCAANTVPKPLLSLVFFPDLVAGTANSFIHGDHVLSIKRLLLDSVTPAIRQSASTGGSVSPVHPNRVAAPTANLALRGSSLALFLGSNLPVLHPYLAHTVTCIGTCRVCSLK